MVADGNRRPGGGVPWRWLAAAVVVVLLGVGVAGWVALPDWIATRAREKLERLAQRHGQRLEIGALAVEPLTGATVSDLRIADAGNAAAPWLTLPRVEVTWQLSGVLSPKLHLQRVDVVGGALRVERRADGVVPLQQLFERWRAGAADAGDEDPAGEAGSGGLRAYIGASVPAVAVRDFQLRIDDASGPSLAVAEGLDLRHLEVMLATLELSDHSPVSDHHDLRLEATSHVKGLKAPLRVQAELLWPQRKGQLQVRSAEPIAAVAGGFRIQVGGIEIDSSGQVRVDELAVAPADGDDSFAIDVRRVAVALTWPARPESAIPEALRKRLPAPALLALRHVQGLDLEDPVWVGRRPDVRAAPTTAGAVDKNAAASATTLMPRATDATAGAETTPAPVKPARAPAPQAGESDEDAEDETEADSAEAAREAALAVEDAPPGSGPGGRPGAKGPARRGGGPTAAEVKAALAVQRAQKAQALADAKADAEPGAKVRNALAGVFDASANRLESSLGKLRAALQAMPVERITLLRGRARYHDERPRAVAAGEVSNFAARIERKADGMVELEVSFATESGPQSPAASAAAAAAVAADPSSAPVAAANTIRGQVATATGDANLDIQLDRLPLAPWGAVLPRSLRVHPDSLLRETRIQLRYDSRARTIALEGKGEVAHFDLEARRLALHVIADLVVRGSGKILLDLGQDKLAATGIELAIGRASALIEAKISKARTAPILDLDIQVPTLECQDAADSLVGPIAPMLAGARCTGTIAFRVDVGLDTSKMSSLKLEFEPTLRNVEIQSMGKHIDFGVLRGPFWQHARQKDASIYSFITGPGAESWVSLAEISADMVKVVTTSEDGSFFWHRGFSLQAIRDAIVANLSQGRFVRGASTISQQVVKNLFFVEREKTLSRKLQEAVVTWELEHRFSKEEILGLYFNIIEFGPQIYGIRAASQRYFARHPVNLTLLQSIWLGSIIPSPRGHYHHFAKGQVTDTWRTHLCWLADIMLKREKITAEERARLAECHVVFGGGADGSEVPADGGLGHDLDSWDADALPPGDPDSPPPPPEPEGRRIAPVPDAPGPPPGPDPRRLPVP